MRWSIIRLIWLRELRDQLRDRRTVLMITVLPILLYPALGFGVLHFALGFRTQPSVIGIEGSEYLPPLTPLSGGLSPLPALAAWLAIPVGGMGTGAEPVAVAVALTDLSRQGLGSDPPPLLTVEGEPPRFLPLYFSSPEAAANVQVKLQGPGAGRGALGSKRIDLLLVVPRDLREQLAQGRKPALSIVLRDGDDRSRLAHARLDAVLGSWQKLIKGGRLLAHQLPADYDEVFETRVATTSSTGQRDKAEAVFEALARVFPFLLVLWSLTGALYPAVDLCAGEKERGTMETLLISPASREEIVYGKFLTIWVFSAVTALLNLASMGVTTLEFAAHLPTVSFRLAPLLWCVLLVLPLSAFFSALCLAIGAYARSSKEGQYYLMPLFLLTMPLILLTMAPGIELNAFYSMLPVAGVALLLQRLVLAPTLAHVPWGYFIPVVGTMILYGWLALRWAVSQFQREEVLFREAERLDLGLWLRHLLRDKEPIPSFGQAVFCFALLLVLRWLSLGFSQQLPIAARAAIAGLAFVATPPLLLAVMLTTQPLLGLGLSRPSLRHVITGIFLAVCLLPLAGQALAALQRYPDMPEVLRGQYPLTGELVAVAQGRSSSWWTFLLLLLPGLCEELAFRGYLLGGLRRRFHSWTAILLGAFLYALYSLNIYQLLPGFLMGVALGVLAVRSGSVIPGMLFHVVHVGLLLVLVWLGGTTVSALGVVLATVGAFAAAAVLTGLGTRIGPPPEPAWSSPP